MSQNQERSSSVSSPWIVGCLGAAGVIVAAIIALGAPMAERAADYYFPTLTPIPNIPPTSTSISFEHPTQTTIITVYPQATVQQPLGICQEAGGASGFPLPPTPSTPPAGCVLIIEWWVPPDANNCGILITTKEPIVPAGSIGAWWYVYPQRPDSQKQEFLAKNPHCRVEDLR